MLEPLFFSFIRLRRFLYTWGAFSSEGRGSSFLLPRMRKESVSYETRQKIVDEDYMLYTLNYHANGHDAGDSICRGSY
jgi:hypothetical protein